MDKKKEVLERPETVKAPVSTDQAVLDIYRVRDLLGIDSESFGLREQNKVDKLQRIFRAARRHFAEVGYDATTLRDIAKEARVALGTLNFYAESKSELVLLVFNTAMPKVLEKCRQAGVYDGSLSDALIAFFRPAYTAYAEEPGLFRVLLRENVFHTHSPHAREFHRIRVQTIDALRKLIDEARDNGEIRAHIDVDLTARTIFFIMFAAVRIWISSDQPTVDAGLTELRSMIALLLDGMRSDTAERVRGTPGKMRRRG